LEGNRKLAACLFMAVIVFLGLAIALRERHYSVKRSPNNSPNVAITLAADQNEIDLGQGIVHCQIKNTGEKPLSVLVGLEYPSMGVVWPDEAYNHARQGSSKFHPWHETDFMTIHPNEAVEADVQVFDGLGDSKHPNHVGLYTGQVFYYGDVVNGYRSTVQVSGHSDLGRISGPMVTIRKDREGITILL